LSVPKKSDPEDVKWSGYASAPDPAGFRKWFDAALIDPDRLLFSAVCDDEIVGYCHFRRSGDIFEPSYGTAAVYRKRGIAGVALMGGIAAIRAVFPGATIHCWIAESNLASQRSVSKKGFVKTHQTKDQEFKHPVRVETMRLWLARP
jgi:hypothetical protein